MSVVYCASAFIITRTICGRVRALAGIVVMSQGQILWNKWAVA